MMVPRGQDVGELVALALAGVGAGIGGQQVGQQLLGVHPKDHPVDGLKLQGVVVEVHQLHQGIPGGVGLLLLGGEGGLELFPAGLGGGQGVVPIPHGVGEHGLAGGVVEFLKPLRVP